MSTLNNSLLLGAPASGGYQIQRSLRFNSSDSAFLSRTPASSGSLTRWTWAGWIKKSGQGSTQGVFGVEVGAIQHRFGFKSDEKFEYLLYSGSFPLPANKVTTQVFRDPSAWFHLVVVWDSANSTASDRMQIYVNGQRITAFDASTDPTASLSGHINSSSYQHYISNGFNGLLADVFFIDGQALDPSAFVAVSATTGRLEPKAYSGPTPTGNSFWLPFSDNSAATATTLGKDGFLLGNNWTCNNLVVTSGPSDANASSLVLAVPMDGANNGTTFNDLSATIKGSGSAKTITANSAITSTSQSRFYGSSGYLSNNAMRVNASADFEFPGDFTIEFWVYKAGYNRFATPLMINPDTGQLVSINMGNSINGWLFAVGNSDYAATSTFTASTWTHLAMCRSGGTVYCFINGQLAGTFSSSGTVGSSTQQPYIGDYRGDNQYSFNGWIQDLRIYKGVAKYTSSFSLPGPLKGYSAADVDSTVDTPTSYGTDTGAGGEVRGNYATLNPLASAGTFSNGNLEVSVGSLAETSGLATFGLPASGKWYWEVAITAVGTDSWIGISTGNSQTSLGSSYYIYRFSGAFSGSPAPTSTPPTGATYTTGDIIGVAYNADAATLALYKNNAIQGTFTGIPAGLYFPVTYCYNNANRTLNFGQRQWAYAAPAGFKALCDTNLPAPVVAKPSTVMDVVLWTGSNTATARTISGLQFSPDLVWAKSRSLAYSHNFYDTVRGTGKGLYSDSTGAESTNNIYGYISAFNSDGFTGTPGSTDNGFFNQTNATYAAWCFDAGTTTTTNTQGSITSSVRASASSGFSIVTYQANAPNNTIGHGLGVRPEFVITKARTRNDNWLVYHSALGVNQWLHLNLSAAAITTSGIWGTSGNWTSTTFGVSTSGIEGNNYGSNDFVAYCFAPVAGYSAMGSYTGNGSTDGPFQWCGFRPRFLLAKSTGSGGWVIYDAARDTYNFARYELYPHTSGAEVTNDASYSFDFLSNGFKVRRAGDSSLNTNGQSVIWAAFAESPFQYARAR